MAKSCFGPSQIDEKGHELFEEEQEITAEILYDRYLWHEMQSVL
jgi:hypothetical protein